MPQPKPDQLLFALGGADPHAIGDAWAALGDDARADLWPMLSALLLKHPDWLTWGMPLATKSHTRVWDALEHLNLTEERAWVIGHLGESRAVMAPVHLAHTHLVRALEEALFCSASLVDPPDLDGDDGALRQEIIRTIEAFIIDWKARLLLPTRYQVTHGRLARASMRLRLTDARCVHWMALLWVGRWLARGELHRASMMLDTLNAPLGLRRHDWPSETAALMLKYAQPYISPAHPITLQ